VGGSKKIPSLNHDLRLKNLIKEPPLTRSLLSKLKKIKMSFTRRN
jgi:hypothetical protein